MGMLVVKSMTFDTTGERNHGCIVVNAVLLYAALSYDTNLHHGFHLKFVHL